MNSMGFVFIVSQHRTGSTLLRNIIDANSRVSMAFDEMNLYEPMRKHTLDRLLADGMDVDSLILAIQNREIYGTFWQDFSRSGIQTPQLKSKLEKCGGLTPRKVLQTVLDCLAETNGAAFVGVKYPLHFSRLDLLKEWFPDSKVIMLFRNPKGMIASKLNDPATRARKERSWIHRFVIHYFTLLFFSFDFVRSVSTYKRNRDAVYKVNYEALVTEQRSVVEGVCRHCGIEFEEQMLSVSGKESSFGIEGRNKVSSSSLNKYQQVLSRFDQWLIDFLTARSYRKVQCNSLF